MSVVLEESRAIYAAVKSLKSISKPKKLYVQLLVLGLKLTDLVYTYKLSDDYVQELRETMQQLIKLENLGEKNVRAYHKLLQWYSKRATKLIKNNLS